VASKRGLETGCKCLEKPGENAGKSGRKGIEDASFRKRNRRREQGDVDGE